MQIERDEKGVLLFDFITKQLAGGIDIRLSGALAVFEPFCLQHKDGQLKDKIC